MRLILPFLLCAALPVASQTVSNITFQGIGDSSVQVLFDVSSTYNTFQIRYGLTACTGGTGGTVQANGTSPGTYSKSTMTGNLAGLNPSTLYHVCPEVSNTGGPPFSSGVESTFTTGPRNATVIPPTPVDIDFPVPSGTIRPVLANCSNLQAQINASVPGDDVVVPKSSTCTGSYSTPTNPDALTFTPSDVRTSDSRITVTHTFTEDQEVRLSSGAPNSLYLPGMKIFPYAYNANYGGGWRKGAKYYVHVVDSTHVQIQDAPNGNLVVPGYIQFTCNAATDDVTFRPDWRSPFGFSVGGGATIPANTSMQVRAGTTLCGGLTADTPYFILTACPATRDTACVSKLSLTSGGAQVDITSTGTGTQTFVDQGSGTMYIIGAPNANAQYITIRSDGNLMPDGTRVGPLEISDTEFFHMKQNTPVDITQRFSTGILAYNWRLKGVIFDTATNTDYLTTVDPRPYCGTWTTGQDSANIFFDQIQVRGANYPNRFGCTTTMFWDGESTGIINSNLDGLNYWYPWYTGFAPSVQGAGSVARIGAGSGFSGASIFGTTTTITNSDWTLSGSTSGTAEWYLAMDGTMKILPPTGITGSCTTTGTTCTVLSPVASPALPVNGNGRLAGLSLATVTIVSGSVTAVTRGNGSASANGVEGTSAIIAGIGPGPYIFQNNFVSGTGIPLHFDDSGGPFAIRHDYTVAKSFFLTPIEQLANGSVSSNTLKYGHRQPLEWKAGQRIAVHGNIFEGSFNEVTSSSVSVALTPRAGGYMSDFSMISNWFRRAVGGANLPAPIDANYPVSIPSQRSEFSNNLFVLDGFTQRTIQNPITLQPQYGGGWAFYSSYCQEDINIHNNTMWKPKGAYPAFLYWTICPASGQKLNHNVMARSVGNVATGLAVSEGVSNCPYVNYQLIQCAWTNGPGNTAYDMNFNALVTSWSDAYTASPSTSVSEATACNGVTEINGTFGGGACTGSIMTYFPTGANVDARWDALLYISPPTNFRLNPASPLISTGVDGVDFEQLLNDNGVVRDIVVTPSSSSVQACFTAPDTKAVYLGISADAGATWTYPATVTGAAGARCGTATGLLPVTGYMLRVLDYFDQTAALGFSGAEITTSSFTTLAPFGASSFRGTARVGVR